MVYMAGDNTLGQFAATNLAQMAQAGVNPEVQVVVQAEFNQEAFSEAGLTPAEFDRNNYDTFRYVMDGSITAPTRKVLFGPVTDIGNVNMTDPAQLHAFVQWAEQIAPSQRTVLVLWNHGGDEAGLIEDDTSAPGNLLSLSQLTSALDGLPTVDVLYFEMCLMGGYEPLLAVRNEAHTVVASEDEEYVAGWDFNRLLTAMYSNSTATNRTVAANLANAFDAAYVGLPLSETIAAYDLSGFGAVDAAISQLGTALTNSSTVSSPSVALATQNVQRYGYRWVADLVDFTDTLRGHFSDPTVTAAAMAVRQAVTSPSFLLASHYRNGTEYDQPVESRSHGLTIVMPAAGPDNSMPSSGIASMTAYQQQFPSTTWGAYLRRYTASIQAQPFINVGTTPLTLWQVWDTVFAKRGQLEMLLLEPDGTLSGPVIGSLSPSGVFSAGAQATGANYEGWASHQYVETGTFYFLAWLVSDPTNYQPLVNVAYRYGNVALTSLYQVGTYPKMSFDHSFFADPYPTSANLLNSVYTDLKPVATWTPVAANDMASLRRSSGIDPSRPVITAAQIAALQGLASGSIHLRAERPVTSPVLRAGSNASLSRFFPVGHPRQ
jgi:hypothetical protein